MEDAPRSRISDHHELNQWLGGGVADCESSIVPRTVVLLVHHPDICQHPHAENIVRSFHNDDNITLVELERPLSSETEVILQWRLSALSQRCRMLILVNNNAYEELAIGLSPAEVHLKI